MSMQISIETYLDDAPARAQQAEIRAENERLNQGLEETEKRTKTAFDNAVGAMRAGYMMTAGFAQIMGTSMSQIFSSMYGAAVSAIGTYTAIATAIEATGPVGWIQAGIMFTSLMIALIGLGQLMDGQQKLGIQLNGINMSLQGFSQLISEFNFS